MSLLSRLGFNPPVVDENLVALRKHSLFQDISDRDFVKFARLLNERKYETGEVIYRKNFPQSVLFLVVKGHVELHREESLDSPIIGSADDNTYLGITELLSGTSRAESAIARTEVVLFAISIRDFTRYLEQYPSVGVRLMANLARELSRRLEREEVA
jgi:CRP-like cAMP-binding protein